jgi:predicted secreted protein
LSKYAGKDTVIEFDNAAGSLVDMSQHILTITNPAIEAALEESHTFGDSWKEQLNAGLKMVSDITITGFYDDAASTGPDVIFNAVGNTTTRTLKVTYGSTKTFSVETIIKRYAVGPNKGALTTYEVVLAATGAVTQT